MEKRFILLFSLSQKEKKRLVSYENTNVETLKNQPVENLPFSPKKFIFFIFSTAFCLWKKRWKFEIYQKNEIF